jgi:hypothetical protein
MGFNQNILYNSMAIVPSKNLITNIGDTIDSENSDPERMLPKEMRVKKYKLNELDQNLTHPKFKIVDFNYGKKLGLKKTSRFKKVWIRIERALRILIFGGPKYFFLKLNRYLKRYKNYEKHLRKIK